MSIKYIKPVYSKTVKGGLLEDKSTSGKGYQDASLYNDTFNDINEDHFPRGINENTEDRFTQELLNLPYEAGKRSENDVTYEFKITHADKAAAVEAKANPAINKESLIEGYAAVYYQDETQPIAVQNKRTGKFLVNDETVAMLNGLLGEPAKANPVEKVSVTFDKTTKSHKVVVSFKSDPSAQLETLNGILTADTLKAFARFNLEDDFEGDNLGEIELVMSDYKFEPRPTSIGVTWSQLAEITLDASFGLSAQDMLVTYAGDAIRINLDLRAFKLAYAVAKANKDYYTVFDAAYAKDATNIEGYFHTAQTFPNAVDTITDKMVNDINRGGVSRMVAGASAGTYMKLVKGTFSDKGRQTAKGIYQIGEFGGIPTFKAPSSIIPYDEVLCVWKDDDNEGDVAIAFGTLVPFFNTGIIQRKNFYKEVGLATYGDWAVMNRRYLALIKIANLKDTAESSNGMRDYSRNGN